MCVCVSSKSFYRFQEDSHWVRRKTCPWSVAILYLVVIIALHALASIPQAEFFVFITVRRITRPGTSCLRTHQIFMYLWSVNIFHLYIENSLSGVYKKMHVGRCFTSGVVGCAAARL